MKITHIFITALLVTLATGSADLLVYEPFDYKTHNDEVFGRLDGRNGGLGFSGPWQDTDGRDNNGYAFIFDQQGNPKDLYDGDWGKEKPTWDGVVDNLPTMGNYVGNSDWNGNGDRINSSRKLARSAGEMAKPNGGVLWLSSVWHFPEQSFFAPVGIALTSNGGGLTGRAHGISNGGDGIYLAEDAGGYQPCVSAAVSSAGHGETTFGPFTNPRPGDRSLKFTIGLPDLSKPVLNRVWGNDTTVSLHFSEAMLPTTALDLKNYTIIEDRGRQIAVSSAKFHPANNNVMLTLATPLKPAASYTITTSNLTDRSNLPLVEPAINLNTWDDNPNGVKVFILAGQSNMVGRGHYDKGNGDKIGGVGSLREQIIQDPKNYGQLVDPEGKWKEIESMKFWWNRADLGGGHRITKGNLTVGYGAGPDCIGPEYGFGWGIHQFYKDEPVLIIKTAWGGKSLHTDYCSPTAAAGRDGKIGPYYLQMMDQVHQVLSNLNEEFPEFTGKGYQIAGFGWHQGYNDMLSDVMTNAYEKNMVMFIRDIRAEFGKPNLPFSIATTGHGGMEVTLEKRPTLAGQLAVADPKKYPEFAGNVFTVDTRPFQRSTEVSPRNDGSHWHNNGETLWLIGKGMGDGMVEMLGD